MATLEPLEQPGAPPHNPYCSSKSYKDALLAEVEDASNKLGVDTFKLMYLLHKSEDGKEADVNQMQEETQSISSDNTQSKSNISPWYTKRMQFQITLSDTTPETYMDDLTGHINWVLEVINLNTPGVKLAPWHKREAKQEELISELSEDPMDAIRYLYGYKAGTGKAGAQYFRINLAIPSHFTAEDVVKRNKNSIMIPGQQSLLLANSQSINPTTIGWLLRSNPTMVDFQDLEKILRALWTVKDGFGLYWAVVRDGDKYDPLTSTRAIHIETEEEDAPRVISLAERTYGGRFSNKLEDYPLGISMMFVRPFNGVPAKACGNVKKLAAYQKTNEMMLTSYSWSGEVALERSIHPDKFESFRHWLMSLISIKEKPKKDGTVYKDKLFTSIHRSPNKLETRFHFYQSNKQEAINVISRLPLMVKTELGLDPGCFFRKAEYTGILDGEWDAHKRLYKNKTVLNQEQYLQELDDCFLANSEYLPEVVIMEKGGKMSNHDAAAKVMAMANGEDDASVLSQLTDKTLKEATSCPMNGGTSTTSSVTSAQSGNTSKSKTQAAAKEALKEVSIEHNKAMIEQKLLFQKEIEALRKALEERAALTSTNNVPQEDGNDTPRERNAIENNHATTQNEKQPVAYHTDYGSTHQSAGDTDMVQVEDSSDDEASLPQHTKTGRRRETIVAQSPIHKRPKCSKLRSSKAKDGQFHSPCDDHA